MKTRHRSWIACWLISASMLSLMSSCNDNPLSPSTAAPTKLTLVSPNGGEVFSLSDSMLVRWDMSDSVDGLINQLVFDISLDSGKTFQYLGDMRRTSPDWKTRSIRFSLRDSTWDDQNLVWKTIAPSNGCIINIYSYVNHSIGDESDNLFRIK